MLKKEIKERKTQDPKNVPNIGMEFEKIIDKEKIICPIIFTSKGPLVANNTLVEYPIRCSSVINMQIGSDDEKIKSLDYGALNQLSNGNIRLASYQITEYIIQTSFVNICSAFTSNEDWDLFRFIPLLQYIKEEFDNNRHNINSYIYDLIYQYRYSSLDCMSDERLTCDKNTIIFTSKAISQYVCSIYSFGAEKAINDIIYQIHLTPNIKELYKELATRDDFLKSLHGSDDYPTFAALYLKNIMVDIIDSAMMATAASIEKILKGIVVDTFYLFDDEARLRHIDKEVKKGKSKEEAIDSIINNRKNF